MRLICPNCDAHYEVESRLIPENGRDVQCSSCGDTWFQPPPSEEDEQNPDLESDIFASTSDADNTLRGQEDEPEESMVPDFAHEDEEEDEIEEPVPPSSPEPERASLDAAVLDVLRQEAEREKQARIDEGSIDPSDRSGTPDDIERDNSDDHADLVFEPEEEVRERTARLRGIEPEDLSDGSPTARSDLLPDIEEINSTLRATSDRKTGEAVEDQEDVDQKNRSGFRTGFSLIIVLVTILLLFYSFAPQIGQRVPAMQPALDSFVRTADQARMQIDGFMEAVIEKMNSDEGAAE